MSENLKLISPEVAFHMGSRLAQEYGVRLDSAIGAGSAAWTDLQLTHIEADLLRWQRPALNALDLFVINTSINPGAKSFRRVMVETTGAAEIIGDHADNLPRVDANVTSDTVDLALLGAAFGYGIADVWAGQMAAQSGIGPAIQLEVLGAEGARQAIDEKHNRLAWFGDKNANIWGLLTHPGIPRVYCATDPTTGTFQQLITMLGGIFQQVKSNTNQVEKPNRLLMASKLYDFLALQQNTLGTAFVLDMLAKGLGITPDNIVPVWELNGAGDAVGGDLVIADRKDKYVGSILMPVLFMSLPVQVKGLEYEVNCLGKSGGFFSSKPFGIAIGEMPVAL